MNKSQNKKLQEKAFSYWEKAETTYLASPEYYDEQETNLREILQKYGTFDSGLDIGCGDGRYTLVALDYANSVLGVDIGRSLLAQAEQNKLNNDEGDRASFAHQSVTNLSLAETFDLVMCLGVISALIADDLFEKAVSGIGSAVKLGGCLITKDTLSFAATDISQQGDYVACYRNLDIYLQEFAAAGFELIESQQLVQGSATTANSLFVFRKVE